MPFSRLTLYSIGYDIIQIEKQIKKILSKVLNTFGNIMENGAVALLSKCSIFLNIFKYLRFQRRQKYRVNKQ